MDWGSFMDVPLLIALIIVVIQLNKLARHNGDISKKVDQIIERLK